MTGQPPTPIATRYTVSALPLDDINARHVMVFVDRQRGGRWAVHDGGDRPQFVDADGMWAFREPAAMDYDTWREQFHHDYDTAVKLAQDATLDLREQFAQYLDRDIGQETP